MTRSNDILGHYELKNYTQGTNTPDGKFKWYETGDGSYDGECIDIMTYRDGLFSGIVRLGGKAYPITGFYDEDTCSVGYASCYDYLLGDKLVDITYGSIKDGNMSLTGYTCSATLNNTLTAYHFTFVKNGYAEKVRDFKEVDIDYTSFLNPDHDGTREIVDNEVYTYRKLDFKNGVYNIEIKVEKEGEVTIHPASGVTVMQNSKLTAIKIIYIYQGHTREEWLESIGDDVLIFTDQFKNGMTTKSTLYMSKDGKPKALPKPLNVSGWKFSGDFFAYSYKDGKERTLSFVYDMAYRQIGMESCMVITDTEFGYVSHIWPGTNYVTFLCKPIGADGERDYGEFIGYIDPNSGTLKAYGLLFDAKGMTNTVRLKLRRVD